MLVAEPWLDRVATSVTAAVVRSGEPGSSATTRERCRSSPPTAAMGVGDRRTPRAASDPVTMLLALSGGRPVDLTLGVDATRRGPARGTPRQRTVDIGPRADQSFVGAA